MNEPRSSLPQIGQWHGLEDLQRLQEKQLSQTVTWASRSPFYRDRLNSTALPATAADLAGLPLTTKQDLRDNYPFGMLAVPKERLATYHESSGTAGAPTPSYYTAEDWTDTIDVGNVTTVTLDISKDNVQLGLRAVDTAGNRSPVAFPAVAA